jgi:hypothetical protein
MFGGSRGSCPIDRQGFASTGLTAGPGSCGKACPRVLSKLHCCSYFVSDDLPDRLPEGVHSSLFVDNSALWVHSPRKKEAVPVLQEGVREVYRWAWEKKLTLNLKKCEVSFSADPHEAKWQPVVEVKGTRLTFNPNPLFLGVELGRTLSGKKQADRKAASLTKGSRMLTALSGSDWSWSSDLFRKVY